MEEVEKTVVAVLGESGIGKTDLCHKFISLVSSLSGAKSDKKKGKSKKKKRGVIPDLSSEIDFCPTFCEWYESKYYSLVEMGGAASYLLRKRGCYYLREVKFLCLCYSVSKERYDSSLAYLEKKILPELKIERFDDNRKVVIVGLLENEDGGKEIKEVIGKCEGRLSKMKEHGFNYFESVVLCPKSAKRLDGLRSIFSSCMNFDKLVNSRKSTSGKNSPSKKGIGGLFQSGSQSRGFNFGSMARSSNLELKKRDDHSVRKLPGFELLFYAFAGDLQKVKSYANDGVNLNKRDENDQTAFFLAVQNKRCSIIQELLRFPDIEVNNISQYGPASINGETPLTFAAQQGEDYKTVVKILLASSRIDKKRKNKFQYSAQEMCRNDKITATFSKQKEREKQFLEYVQQKEFEKVKKYAEHVDPGCTNAQGENGLEIALKNEKNLKMVNFLLQRTYVFKAMYLINRKYRKMLEKQYNWQTRDHILIELVRTEKTYGERLQDLIDGFLVPIQTLMGKLVKKKKDREALNVFIEQIKKIRLVSKKVAIVMSKAYDKSDARHQIEMVDLIKTIDFSQYRAYFRALLVEEDIRDSSSFEDLRNFLEKRKSAVQKNFFSLTVLPKDRMIHYQNLISRLLKYSKIGEQNQPIHTNTVDALKLILDTLHDSDDDVFNEKMLREVNEIFGKRYKLSTNDVFGNTPTIGKRHYVFHFECPGFSLKKEEAFLKLQTIRVFLLSDLIGIETTAKKDRFIRFYYFRQHKTFITINEDSASIKIFDKKQKVLCHYVLTVQSGKLAKLSDATKFYTEKYEIYHSTIKIFDHTGDKKKMEDFLLSRKRAALDIKVGLLRKLDAESLLLDEKRSDMEKERFVLIYQIKALKKRRETISLKIEGSGYRRSFDKTIESPLEKKM